jgi:hypothetical protein
MLPGFWLHKHVEFLAGTAITAILTFDSRQRKRRYSHGSLHSISALTSNLSFNVYFIAPMRPSIHPHALAVSAFRRPRSCRPTLIPVSLGTGFTPTTLAPVSMTPCFSDPHIPSLRTKKRTDGGMFATTFMENTKRMVRSYSFEGNAQALDFEVCGLLFGVG